MFNNWVSFAIKYDFLLKPETFWMKWILKLANLGKIQVFLEYNLLQNQSIKLAEAIYCNNLFKQ